MRTLWLMLFATSLTSLFAIEAENRYHTGPIPKWDLTKNKPGVVENGAIIWYAGAGVDDAQATGPSLTTTLALVTRCYQQWASTTGSVLCFKQGGQTTEDWTNYTHNIILFPRNYSFPQNVWGTTLYARGVTCILINPTVLFDPRVAAHVILHEIGHSIGLNHSDTTLAVMYYASGIGSRPILYPDDRKGVLALYPDPNYHGPSPDDPSYPGYYDPTHSLSGPQITPSTPEGYAPLFTNFTISGDIEGPHTWDYAVETTVSMTGQPIYTAVGTYTVTLTIKSYWDDQLYASTCIVTVLPDPEEVASATGRYNTRSGSLKMVISGSSLVRAYSVLIDSTSFPVWKFALKKGVLSIQLRKALGSVFSPPPTEIRVRGVASDNVPRLCRCPVNPSKGRF